MERKIKINNDMEQAVSSLVEQLGRSGPKGRDRSSCWCELCKADVTALALSMLPPRYSTVHSYDGCGRMAERNHPGLVTAAVFEAASKVAVKPKHRRPEAKVTASKVKIRNFLMERITELAEQLTQTPEGTCSCGECLSDILSLALNRMPPLYGVEYGERLNIPWRLQASYRDLALKLATAARIVAERPHNCLSQAS